MKRNCSNIKPNVALDADDVLYSCNAYAVELINQEHKMVPPLAVDEITHWGKCGSRADAIFEQFSKRDFWLKQPLISGAKEFVHELCKIANVFILSSPMLENVDVRIRRILDDFPEIPAENIILGGRKDVCVFDIQLDDAVHNITNSKATYPILMRQPWNSFLSGILSVNNLDEALNLIKVIIGGPCIMDIHNAKNICLVGPSGSGKNKIAEALVDAGLYYRIGSYTTANVEEDYKYKYYTRCSRKGFLEKIKNNELLEYSVYGNEYYGTSAHVINTIKNNDNLKFVMVLDICGAMAVRKKLPDTAIVFVERNKKDVISSILNRNLPIEEKVSRIMSIDDEYKNQELCDFILENHGTISDAVSQFL